MSQPMIGFIITCLFQLILCGSLLWLGVHAWLRYNVRVVLAIAVLANIFVGITLYSIYLGVAAIQGT